MTLTAAQRRAVEAPGSVAVTAGAGTGKTHMLTERYVHHVTVDGLGPLEIVAATFTDRAAAELRSRIRARLRSLGASADRTAELEAAQIGTLHALAGRICREHPEAAGVPYDFVLQDPLEQALWRERHVRDALERLPADLARGVPFDTLTGTLRALLDDPYTAEKALRVDASTWPDLIARERVRAFEDIARREAWREAVHTLRAHEGPEDDKMEAQRAAAVAAVAAFEAGRFPAEACDALDSLHAGRGSKKAWGESALQELKQACGTVRDLYREGAYAFTLELGDADEILARAQDDVRAAFAFVRGHLREQKRAQRVLDFNDLELCALRALEDADVVAFYAARWRAFLVDEFQDTNPVQAELLERLTRNATVTAVGDEKQSIYGFRRADVRVFRNVREGIRGEGGEILELAQSFRTHAGLVERTNAVVRPALGDMHQPLEAARTETPGVGPYLSVHLIEAERGVRKPFRQRAEAHRVGEIVEHALVGAGAQVYDKRTGAMRGVRPGDIAVLARTWSELEPFGVELAARGIPTIHAGGGDLFGQREAKDALALLRFLADPADDISLAALLRSPFFAVSDVDLTHFAHRVGRARWERKGDAYAEFDGDGDERSTSSVPDAPTWWSVLRKDLDPGSEDGKPRGGPDGGLAGGPDGGPSAVGSAADARNGAGAAGRGASEDAQETLAFAARVLAELLDRRSERRASELLELADDRTAYTAVIANLPGGPRRLADWTGVLDVVRTLERGYVHPFALVRRLQELVELEGSTVPRPALEAGDAVALMTVHHAKGLEWPVVILPDVTGGGGGGGVDAVFDADAGVAFRVWDATGERVEPALFRILRERAKARDAEEEMRVLYVALTRARDRLFLTANASSGGKLDRIREGLEDAGVPLQVEPYDAANAVPRTPRPVPMERDGDALLEPAGSGFEHLDVTSLTTWAVCPKRFDYQVRQGHPGAPARPGIGSHRPRPDGGRMLDAGVRRLGARIGDLTHRALERGIYEPDALAVHDDTLERAFVERALELADAFRESSVFAPVRGAADTRAEQRVSLALGGAMLHGRADVVGDGWVLDYKTGDPEVDEAHHLQVAVYAEAVRREGGRASTAHIAYLRTEDEGGPHLVTLSEAEQAVALRRALEAVEGIRAGVFEATPGRERCAKCAFEAICDRSAWKDGADGGR